MREGECLDTGGGGGGGGGGGRRGCGDGERSVECVSVCRVI